VTPRSIAPAAASDISLTPQAGRGSRAEHPRLRPWKPLHACNGYESIRAVLEAQSFSGMFPEMVAPPHGRARPDKGSLWQTWVSVNRWRRLLRECPAAASCELVHAHCFAAGMAAVRTFPTVVYELEQFIEEPGGRAAATRRTRRRILRAAEWFALSRSAAIVVRSESLRRQLLRRGAAAEHVFVIPRPLPLAEIEGGRILPFRKGEPGDRGFTIFSTLNVASEWQPWLRELLTAAQAASFEIPRLALHLEIDRVLHVEASRLLSQFGPQFAVLLEDEAASAQAISGCSLVVAGAARQSAVTAAENPLALAALCAAKPLLAADLECNRNVSANGSGCLWFNPGDAADLGRRIVFLAAAAFRHALAASGTRYLRETRSPARVAEQYDAVYWHALCRRRFGKWQTPTVSWQPSVAFI